LTIGTDFSAFGYKWEAFCGAVQEVKTGPDSFWVCFKSNIRMAPLNPRTMPDTIESFLAKQPDIKRLLERRSPDDGVNVDYALYREVLYANPLQVSPFSWITTAKHVSGLLFLKEMIVSDDATVIYAFESPQIRGFQIGDSRVTALVPVYSLFMPNGDKLVFVIDQRHASASLNEAEIWQSIQSFRCLPTKP
jgi:hypothetical protein